MPKADFTVFVRNVISQYVKKEVTVLNYERLGGGCINEAYCIQTDAGPFFLKHNRPNFEVQFEKEAQALELLRATDTLKIPEVFQFGTYQRQAFLLTEFVEPGPPNHGFWEKFGENLAELHRTTSENRQYGLSFDNYIGELPQSNHFCSDWIEFFIIHRLEIQAQLALKNQLIGSDFLKQFQKLYDRLPDLLSEEPPSLIHGDLWSGNFLTGSDGQAVLIDPATYFGNREIELAFTRLFGGFSSTFYESYQHTWPLQPGFEERVDIYNLYPLMVHVNLFGRSYLSGIESVMRRYD